MSTRWRAKSRKGNKASSASGQASPRGRRARAVRDDELLERLRAGDESALRAAMDTYHEKLWYTAIGICGNPEDAEEALQDVYMVLVRKIRQFQGRSALSTWLHRITVNAALMKKRVRTRHEVDVPLGQPNQDLPLGMDRLDSCLQKRSQHDALLAKEVCARIEDSAEELPEKYREVFYLRDVYGFSIRETGLVLGITESAVKSRLHRSRLHIRGQLGDSHRLAA